MNKIEKRGVTEALKPKLDNAGGFKLKKNKGGK